MHFADILMHAGSSPFLSDLALKDTSNRLLRWLASAIAVLLEGGLLLSATAHGGCVAVSCGRVAPQLRLQHAAGYRYAITPVYISIHLHFRPQQERASTI